jgi:hypothetical protein
MVCISLSATERTRTHHPYDDLSRISALGHCFGLPDCPLEIAPSMTTEEALPGHIQMIALPTPQENRFHLQAARNK